MAYEIPALKGIHLVPSVEKTNGAEKAQTVNSEAAAKPTIDDLITQPAETAEVEKKRGFWAKMGDKAAKRVLPKYLSSLGLRRGAIQAEIRQIPHRLQVLTNQATLMLELVDDFRAGRYRALALRNVALGAGALLYAVSPSDVIPDVFPGIGALDDALVIGIAMRIMRKDLIKYCAFKGYDPKNYF